MMKRVRLAVLTGLIIAVLFMTVLPSLAFFPEFAAWPNWSFEFDTDHNGIPNAWNFVGDNTIYVCGHPKDLMYDDCLVGFLASDNRAAIWQDLDNPFSAPPPGYCLMRYSAAARSLDGGRVYGGAHLYLSNGATVTFYGAIPGGSHNFIDHLIFKDYVPALAFNRVESARWGFVALPGIGQSFIDWAYLDCS